MHGPQPLLIHPFGAGDPLALLPQTQQVQYLRAYFADLGAASILEEPQYFDRDYLSEFAAFYGVSTFGYPNVCCRLHFFSGPALQRAELQAAVSGGPDAGDNLQ